MPLNNARKTTIRLSRSAKAPQQPAQPGQPNNGDGQPPVPEVRPLVQCAVQSKHAPDCAPYALPRVPQDEKDHGAAQSTRAKDARIVEDAIQALRSCLDFFQSLGYKQARVVSRSSSEESIVVISDGLPSNYGSTTH
jgi:hypothetical protein